MDLAGRVVTADALHTQRAHAEFLVQQKDAHYIFVVKKNRPALYAQLKRLPWRHLPPGHTERGQATAAKNAAASKPPPSQSDWPSPTRPGHRRHRRTRPLNEGKWRTVTVDAITSLTTTQASPAQLAAWIRGHWRIEALHHIRDVTYRKDRSQTRTRNGPTSWPLSGT